MNKIKTNIIAEYIDESFRAGVSEAQIKETLLAAGWTADIIARSLRQYNGINQKGIPVPVPDAPSDNIAKDLFLYLVSLVCLFVSVLAIGGLYFQIIDRYVQDTKFYTSFMISSVSWDIAKIIICLPTYAWVASFIRRDVELYSHKISSLIRKFSIYLLLAIGLSTMMGDLIATIANFLSGDMTAKFLLKSITICMLAAGIFVYYLLELRDDRRQMQAKQPISEESK